MKQRKHQYEKQGGAWCGLGLNGHVIAANISTELMAQRIANGLDFDLEQRRSARK